MPWILDKLSSPGWEKRFDTKDELVDEVFKFLCETCQDDCGKFKDLYCMLNTACGCELMAEAPDGEPA